MSRFENFLNTILERSEDFVGVYVGRFQGFTIGHYEVAKLLASNHKKYYIVIMKGTKTSENKARNPFPLEVQKEMIEKALGPKFKVVVVKGSFVDGLLKVLEDGQIEGKNIIIYAGSDRFDDYRQSLKYFKEKGYKLSVVDTGQIVPRSEYVSGTKFREALKNDDKEAFKKIAPKEIWSMYEKLKNYVS